MSFHVSAAHSSRIKKSKPPNFKRNTSTISPYASFPRRKPIQRSSIKPRSHECEEDEFGDRLEDVGLMKALATDLTLRDVPQAIQYIRNQMFSPLPQHSVGMNSTRIAEVLNFQRSLPPIVSIAHIQALLNSPTEVEREVAEMIKEGIVRKFVVPGRGGMGEVLILVEDLETMIKENEALDEDVKVRFIKLLRENTSALNVPRAWILAADAKALVHTGFLTSATQSWTSADMFSQPGNGLKGTVTSLHAISKAASGSLAAVGGEGAFHAAGGSGGGVQPQAGNFVLGIPSTGPFLKLQMGARAHLVSLLSKSKFREAPESLLRERWDGKVVGNDTASKEKRNRGEFAGVSHGRTSKWRKFYGLKFEYILEECTGAGLLEVFQTRSVGRGVRAV